MAWTRKATGGNRKSASVRSAKRGVVRKSSNRRAAYGSRSSGQTLRIVLQQAPAAGAATMGLVQRPASKPRRTF